ncbi:TPA: outer membrane usher protein [Aeromonas hydrophila]|nr:outer membrane usher protein [Aeromonas hydrophila]
MTYIFHRSFYLFLYCFFGWLASIGVAHAKEVRFNTNILDVKDRENFDLSLFSQQGYILPGTYDMTISLNNIAIPARSITFFAPEDDPKGSQACLNKELVESLGLTDKAAKELTWWHDGQCLNTSSLKGMEIQGDLGTNTLRISVPQAYLEYSNSTWDPPSRWEEGISGLLLDYNLNAQSQWQDSTGGTDTQSLSGNGVLGANMGAWRIRANWQTKHQSGGQDEASNSFDWTQYTAYRAIVPLKAKLTLGEDYLGSSIFDSFRFRGASLVSDDNMLPPNLRGYAPEVSGVARTNAKVVISQQGRVIKEVLVAAGPFRIQDMDNTVSGKLDVRVEEADGSVQTFQVDTATIPYLTRPGQVRYKLAAGKPTSMNHDIDGPSFATGEFSWGVSNGWSLYGGGLGSNEYNAFSLGMGRDLMVLGALSADITQSNAKLPNDKGSQQGRSYRLSYSKTFDETNSQVTFAGYRFSDENFMTMNDYLNERKNPDSNNMARGKEMYTVSFNQSFPSKQLNVYVNYNHQTYWNQETSDRYNVSLAHYFDIGNLRNVSLSLTAYRNNNFGNMQDDGMYLSLSMPWGNMGTVSYNGSFSRGSSSNSVAYADRIGDDYYQVRAGMSDRDADFSGYYSHRGSLAQVDGTASMRNGQYGSVGVSVMGGATLTPEGGALHRTGVMGGTRMLIDTDGVPDIPIGTYASPVRSNRFGKAVVADISSYYRNSIQVDVNKVADNAQVTNSVVQGTLTEGAIGYRHFDVVAGEKAMASIKLVDGKVPPFGATVLNSKKREVGMMGDDGYAYLSGLKAGETLTVQWAGREACNIILPGKITSNLAATLHLTCK